MHRITLRIGGTANLSIVTLLIVLLPFLSVAKDLPKGWTPPGAIPEKYARLVTCAERHNPVCQLWLAELWTGTDMFTEGINRTSEIFNPPEAEPWLRAAAEQGYPLAMKYYGHHLCLSRYHFVEPTRSRIVEGIAWQLASDPAAEKRLKEGDPFFCAGFQEAIEAEPQARHSMLVQARKRAEQIKSEIQGNSGIWLSLIEPCTPFSWLEKYDPFLVWFHICLKFEVRDLFDYLTQ